jgi:hypothetical protein
MADTSSSYPHRRNKDGSFDSICTACFATIAQASAEADLAECEKVHVCQSSFFAERGLLYQTRPRPNRALGRASRD